MKRLLRLSLDILLASLVPILGWYILGFLINKDAVNVFSITYPLQFVWLLCQGIFCNATNIYVNKNDFSESKKTNLVITSGVIGIVILVLVHVVVFLNLKSYISYMNMDYEIYAVFVTYSLIQLVLQFVLSVFITRRQYRDENLKANNISLIYNITWVITLVTSCLIFRNELLVVATVTLVNIVCIIVLICKESLHIQLDLEFYKAFKYAIFGVVRNIAFIILFFKGLGDLSQFGIAFFVGYNLCGLITDAHWDVLDSVATASDIDCSSNKFSFKTSVLNGIKLLCIIYLSITIMTLVLSNFYNITIYVLINLVVELICMFLSIFYSIYSSWLNINGYILYISINKIISSVLRVLIIVFFSSSYMFAWGIVVTTLYQLIVYGIAFHYIRRVIKCNINIV